MRLQELLRGRQIQRADRYPEELESSFRHKLWAWEAKAKPREEPGLRVAGTHTHTHSALSRGKVILRVTARWVGG